VPRIELQDIQNFVCRGTNLDVRPGELLVLLGPNGAGKTTLLNVIAGLVDYQGRVFFDGSPVDAVPARDRRVGYVFQDLVLFPHLDAAANIAYGLQAAGSSKLEMGKRVKELLNLLGISHLATRYPVRLSGGEKQRVALARALAPHPDILLLDEPFSSLDVRTSGFLRNELKHLQRDLGTTTVFVTHDLAEAEDIADRIAVIQDGLAEQVGAPEEILFSPRGRKVTEYIGSPNVMACRTTRRLGHGLIEADCGGLRVVLPGNGKPIRRVILRPRDVLVSRQRPASEVNVFEGTIQSITPHNGSVMVHLDTGGCRLASELPAALSESMRLRPGSEVFVELSLMKLRAGS